jgi:REP element-mobilizing transposase RayT
MQRPIVIAYHLIWTGYGWWLPNDPRGSNSHCIRCDVLKDLGELHHKRKRPQPASHDLARIYDSASAVLRFPLLTFATTEVERIAAAFQNVIRDQRYTCYACAIMPDHVHILIRKHKHQAEEMTQRLQRESHIALREGGMFDWEHPVWGGPGWKIFLDHPADIWRTIHYIEGNPPKIGWARQNWPSVTRYDGWPLYPEHDLGSPYARRLRARVDD